MPGGRLRIGFVSPGPATWPHYGSLTPMLPAEVELDFRGLGLYGASLDEIAGKKSEIAARVAEWARLYRWNGTIVIGAPTEVFNPGLLETLKATLPIPVTTALSASVCALRAYAVHRVLVLTPFTETLNQLITGYLNDAGYEVVAPHAFRELADASRLAPHQVYELAAKCYDQYNGVDAIYFQGAVLDPVPIIERLENDTNTPTIASNPTMLWHILSQLGRRYPAPGFGKLLSQWPAVPAS